MDEQIGSQRLVDIREMAGILKVPVSWLYRKTRIDEFPHLRIGKYIRFDPEKVLAYLNERPSRQAGKG